MTDTLERTDTYLELDPELLRPAPDNPRRDLGDLDELVSSIRTLGIVEPLVVTRDDDGWLVIAGHRRLEAALTAGLETVPCVVRDADDAERTEIMLVENLIRANLTPIEEADGYAKLTDLGHTQKRIAERVGCNQSHVSKRLKLRKLPDVAVTALVDGRLEVNDALKLAVLPKATVEGLFADGPVPASWEIDSATKRHRAGLARRRGEASGKEETKSTWEFEECEEDEATHFHVSYDGDLTWMRPEPEEPSDAGDDSSTTSTTTSSSTSTPVDQNSDADANSSTPTERQRDEVRVKLLELTKTNPTGVITAGLAVGAHVIASDDYYGGELDAPYGFKEPVCDLDEPALVVTVTILLGEMEMAITSPGEWDLTLPLIEELGVELTDEQREHLPDERPEWLTFDRGVEWAAEQPTTLDAIASADDLPGMWEEADLVGGKADSAIEEAAAAGEAPTEAPASPWPTYDVVSEPRLQATIGQLGDLELLHAAHAYEQATKARDAIEAAIWDRITELEAKAS